MGQPGIALPRIGNIGTSQLWRDYFSGNFRRQDIFRWRQLQSLLHGSWPFLLYDRYYSNSSSCPFASRIGTD